MESKKFSINEYVPAKKAARKDENCEYFCHNFVFESYFLNKRKKYNYAILTQRVSLIPTILGKIP